MADHNVYTIAIEAKPIELEDQGIYYAVNRKTGEINNVFSLSYEEDDWYLYQLKNTDKHGEMGWVILADNGDYPLKSLSAELVQEHFNQPEYTEPKGVWQVMRNSRYGFGKFTPQDAAESAKFAMILFSGEKMLVPLLILKADISPEDSLGQRIL